MTTELYIDDQLVILPADFKIKLIQENPYFTKASTYTRDIKLSLKPLGNRRVFKNIHRMEVTKNVTNWEALLLSNRGLRVKGKAILREVKEDSISLQLVADNSEMNFIGKGDTYIDRLPYKSTLDEQFYFPFGRNWKNLNPEHYIGLFGVYGQSFKDNVVEASFKVNCTFHPIFNTSTNSVMNTIYHVEKNFDGYNAFEYPLYPIGFLPKAPQPYFLFALKLICKKVGYNLIVSSRIESILKYVVICNTALAKTLNEVMPHWTFNEFLTELENWLNVTFVVEGKDLKMVHMDEYYSNNAHREQLQVIDDYSVEIKEEDEDQDVSTSNLSYDLQENGEEFLRLDPELKAKLKEIECNGMTDMESQKLKLSEIERFQVLYTTHGRYYVLQRRTETDIYGKFIEVDRFRDLNRNEADNRIQLRIVPVSMVLVDMMSYESTNAFGEKFKPIKFKILMPAVSGTLNDGAEESKDLIDLIRAPEIEDSKSIIEVAINNTALGETEYTVLKSTEKRRHIHFPTLYTDYTQTLDNEPLIKKHRQTLRLQPVDDLESIGNLHSSERSFYSTKEYTFRFASKKVHNVRNVFLLRNQEYVAKSIELEISAEGVDPIQKAVMYKLNQNMPS